MSFLFTFLRGSIDLFTLSKSCLVLETNLTKYPLMRGLPSNFPGAQDPLFAGVPMVISRCDADNV